MSEDQPDRRAPRPGDLTALIDPTTGIGSRPAARAGVRRRRIIAAVVSLTLVVGATATAAVVHSRNVAERVAAQQAAQEAEAERLARAAELAARIDRAVRESTTAAQTGEEHLAAVTPKLDEALIGEYRTALDALHAAIQGKDQAAMTSARDAVTAHATAADAAAAAFDAAAAEAARVAAEEAARVAAEQEAARVAAEQQAAANATQGPGKQTAGSSTKGAGPSSPASGGGTKSTGGAGGGTGGVTSGGTPSRNGGMDTYEECGLQPDGGYIRCPDQPAPPPPPPPPPLEPCAEGLERRWPSNACVPPINWDEFNNG